MSRLTPIDASFLHLESARTHMNVGWSAMGTLPAGAARPTLEALRARVHGRLRWVPRCRQRLRFHPLGLGDPHWVDDPGFDLAAHVVALGEPGEALSPRRFAQLRDELLSVPLDRARPLWQIALAPLLEDGRIGVVGRVHHAMADGAAALQVAALGLDADGADDAGGDEPWRPEPAPSPALRAVDPLLHGAEMAAQAAGDAARAAMRPRSSARTVLRDAQRVVGALTEDLLPRAPESQLNHDLGPRRTLISHREALDDLRAAGDGTLNDVALTVVAGALRALALERGLPAQPLKALVPVDTRGPHERGALGNHVSLAAVWLPLHLGSPAARLAHVRTATSRFKRAGRPAGVGAVIAGLGLLPSGLRGAMLRAASVGSFNLTVSNIPGPRRPLHMLGAELDEIYPVVPVAEDQALSIGMLRYHRHLHFGLHADPEALPHATRLPALIAAEVRALGDAVEARRTRLPSLTVPAARTPITS
ncbi:MAG TPA: wax ester/triacylglycerol synthase family O-acyltransferase [Solirubrobacteraceae bacterium]|nr:wax ester/triacylglycerol synthase family O-acyltransferase [Solirubrobacteraceae bacterium]